MAHKVRIGGTSYNTLGGKCRISGTNYTIKKGRTRISGTNYDIAFSPPDCTVEFTTLDFTGSTTIMIGGTDYHEYDYENTSMTVPYGTVITGVIEGAKFGARYTTEHYIQITNLSTGEVKEIRNTKESEMSYSYTIESDISITTYYERVY